MEFLSKWFNQYGTQRNFPIHTELLRSEDIYLGEDSPIVKGLRAGGVALVRCRLGCEHYVLLTGLCGEDKVYMFDPYYLKKPLRRRDIEMLEGQPCFANRVVPFARLNRADRDYYAMGQQDARQCVLFFNTAQKQPVEAT